MAKYGVTFKCGHVGEIELYGKYKDRERKKKWYEEEWLCRECWEKEYREEMKKHRKEMSKTHDEVTMKYREYKESYYDCERVWDSYNQETKEIAVFVPKDDITRNKIHIFELKELINMGGTREEIINRIYLRIKGFFEDSSKERSYVESIEAFTSEAWVYLENFIWNKK